MRKQTRPSPRSKLPTGAGLFAPPHVLPHEVGAVGQCHRRHLAYGNKEDLLSGNYWGLYSPVNIFG